MVVYPLETFDIYLSECPLPAAAVTIIRVKNQIAVHDLSVRLSTFSE